MIKPINLDSIESNLQQKFNDNMQDIGYFEPAPTLAIALSGGADSSALLLLAQQWIKQAGGKLIALTVDHQLRLNSALDAAKAQNFSKELSIEHHILKSSDQYKGNIQAAARAMRYKLLVDYCTREHILHLLVAHHLDDKVENFFIRLLHGSDVFGLAELKTSYHATVRVIRPLLNFSKQSLINYLSMREIKWSEDESNYSSKYLRNRLRISLASLNAAMPELTGERFNLRISTVQQKIQFSTYYLRRELISALVKCFRFTSYGSARLDWLLFSTLKEQLQCHLVSYILTLVGGKNQAPRTESIRHLLTNMTQDRFRQDLHGCYLVKADNQVYICRHFGSQAPQTLTLGFSDVTWDSRFTLKLVANGQALPLKVSNFKAQDYTELKKFITIPKVIAVTPIAKEILFSLPAVTYLEKVVCIPHIKYYSMQALSVKSSSSPSFISQLTHF